jgi:hypothetical protein
MTRVSSDKKAFATALQSKFGNVVSRKQVLEYIAGTGEKRPNWLFNTKDFRAGRGSYDLTKVLGATTGTTETVAAA